MTKLTAEAKEGVKSSVIARAALMILFDVNEATIKRWLDEDNYALTTPDALKIIKAETGLKEITE